METADPQALQCSQSRLDREVGGIAFDFEEEEKIGCIGKS